MKIIQFVFISLIISFPLSAQTSPHGALRFKCEDCHTTESWKMWADASFSHAATNFDLTGMHKTLDCRSCHKALQFAGTKSECQSCHVDIHKSELGNTCTRCHSTDTWRITDMVQRHQETRFPLIGKHATADCKQCHFKPSGQQYRGTPTTCLGCHRADYEQTKNPNHRFAGFSTECLQCHIISALRWGGSFDHSLTVFALLGAHQAVSCIQCHTNAVFKSTPKDCRVCHNTAFKSVTDPNHLAAGFSTTCLDCHTMIAWRGGRYDHTVTQFPLTGAHIARRCIDCHGNNIFKGKAKDCYSCHAGVYNSVSSPNHALGGFKRTCEICHTTTIWKPSTFSHATNTSYPLVGAHAAVACDQCHKNNIYAGLSQSCIVCHQSDYNMAANPAHAAGGFPTLCTQCHSMNGWKPATFDHQATKFVLTGKHLIVTCQDCHTNGNYLLVYSSCFQCHQSNYQNSTNPNHAAGGFSIQCETCHSTTAWVPATFNHATTKFPLTGTHVTTACQKCHVNGNYQLTYSSCYQCHQSNYQNSTNPNHIASGFSIQCDLCHSTTAWSPASFNHATTKFPLTGAHLTTACQKCHVNGNYQLAYSSCYQCHQSNYQNSTNPNHTVSGFSTQCDLCHSTTAWSPASFNHATTKFPLTGAHVSVACQTCHTQGNYKLVYTDCYQCHVSDFQRPTSPNHVAELFPHACDMCHTASVWKPVKYNHDSQYFKIYSGAHNRRWTLCRDCHPAPSDYSSYTCTTSCHTQAKMDSEHSGRSGYSYSSPACYSCHRSV